MFDNFSTFIREHQYECLIIATVGVVILDIIFLIYVGISLSSMSEPIDIPAKECPVVEDSVKDVHKNDTTESIIIDISGAVNKPGAYEVSSSARLSHVLRLAGGLHDTADKDFFARNYNISSRLADQQKIYVPRKDEIEDGIFVENTYSIDHTVCTSSEKTSEAANTKDNSTTIGISLNFATQEELESLPGVGPATSKKIVDGRPYDSIDSLLDDKIVSQKVFDDIHDRLKL